MWLDPIYDRTQLDVDTIKLDPTNENTKGAYNYTDLNRVENNCEYVMNLLNNSGLFYIPVTISVKTDWTVDDIPNIKDINRIRNNIITLKNGMNLGDEYKENWKTVMKKLASDIDGYSIWEKNTYKR